MNRAEKRRQEREVKKSVGALKALTPEQLKLIDMMSEEKAKKSIDSFSNVLDRGMTSALMDRSWSIEEIEKLQNEIAALMMEDVEKMNKYKKENIDMAKIEKEVREYIVSLFDREVNKKEALEDLQFKFPKLSKSMLNVAYSKVKEEFETEKAAEQIVNIIDKKDIEKENKPLKVDKGRKDTKEEKKAKKEVKKDMAKEGKLKVLTMVLEGKNGKYTVSNGSVELPIRDKLIFKDIEDLEHFAEEVIEVFKMIK